MVLQKVLLLLSVKDPKQHQRLLCHLKVHIILLVGWLLCLDVVEQTMLKTTKRSTDQRVKYSIAGDPGAFVDSLSAGISGWLNNL
jgi:hypothetical protein